MSDGFEVRKSDDDQFYVVLKSANGEVVATSETYTREADAERAIGDIRAAVEEGAASEQEE